MQETKRASSEQLGDYIHLNEYKLDRVLGQGSYGLVKLAYNKEENKNYVRLLHSPSRILIINFQAMKILSKKKLQKKAGLFFRRPPSKKGGGGGGSSGKPDDPLDKVYREIATLKKIDHPNVVKLVEVVNDPMEDNLYMVFELLEKGEVLEIPSSTPLTEEAAWQCFRDVVHGLEYRE